MLCLMASLCLGGWGRSQERVRFKAAAKVACVLCSLAPLPVLLLGDSSPLLPWRLDAGFGLLWSVGPFVKALSSFMMKVLAVTLGSCLGVGGWGGDGREMEGQELSLSRPCAHCMDCLEPSLVFCDDV